MCLSHLASSLCLHRVITRSHSWADDSRRAREGLVSTDPGQQHDGGCVLALKKLKLVGVTSAVWGNKAINLSLGYAHQVIVGIPEASR